MEKRKSMRDSETVKGEREREREKEREREREREIERVWSGSVDLL